MVLGNERGSSAFDNISEYIYRGNEVQMGNVAFVDELKSWMRYNKRHQDQHLDGLSIGKLGNDFLSFVYYVAVVIHFFLPSP